MARSNAVHVVQGEVTSVVSCMRRNTRWAAADHDDQDPLLRSFSSLKQHLATVTDLSQVEVDRYIKPFLDVIRSEATAGIITGVALSSINKFLSYGLMDPKLPETQTAIENIADAVTHAKFVGTDLASDEVVLMKILQVLRTLLLCSTGPQLSNESVCELLQSCFRICFEMRLSELLRRTAEQTITDMLLCLFSRLGSHEFLPQDASATSPRNPKLHIAQPDEELDVTSPTEAAPADALASPDGTAPPATATASAAPTSAASAAATGANASASAAPAPAAASAAPTASAVTLAPPTGAAVAAAERFNSRGVCFTQHKAGHEHMTPYGIASIQEILRFLIALINPRDRHNNETMISMGLSMLTVALEVGGCHMALYPMLMEHVEDSLCRNLFALLRTDNLTIYSAALRAIFLLFEALRHRLKYQLGAFIKLVTEMTFPSYEHREGALDTLLQLCRLPSFLIELYLNFDCHLYSENLFELVVRFLGGHACPDEASLFTTHLLALNALLTSVNEIGTRADRVRSGAATPAACVSNDPASPAALLEVKRRKGLLLEGIALFNKDAGDGVKMLQKQLILADPLNATELAYFFRSDPRLDKAQIGDFLSKRKHTAVLEAFIDSFDVSDRNLDEALRMFLSTFRLPGESAVIERIFDLFAGRWFQTHKGERIVRSKDAAFVLSYAIIQLNVDQHNPRVKHPMTLKQFINQVRGINDKESFPDDFVEAIYNNIKSREIVLPDEREGELKAEHDWRMMLARARDPLVLATPILTCQDRDLYDNHVFLQVWRPTITALASIFDLAADEDLLEKTVKGFRMCAGICTRFEMSDVFDFLVVALCKRTLLGAEPNADHASLNNLATGFVETKKAQLAARAAFALTREHGDIIRDAWHNIIDALVCLFHARLLTQPLMEMASFVTGPQPILAPTPEDQLRRESSFISALSYFLASDPAPKPRDGYREAHTRAKDVVAQFELAELIADSAFLRRESLDDLCKALMARARGLDEYAALGLDAAAFEERTAVFAMELLAEVALANRDRIQLVWEPISRQLFTHVRAHDAGLLSERALVCLLRLAERLYAKEAAGDKVIEVLRVLAELPAATRVRVRQQLVAGTVSFIKVNAVYTKQEAVWELIMSMLMTAIPDPAATTVALDGLVALCSEHLTRDNFYPAAHLAIAFTDIAVASVADIADSRSRATADGSAQPDPLAIRFLNLLHTLHLAVPRLFGVEKVGTEEGAESWLPLLQAMCRFCLVPSRAVRQHALTLLHSSLMLTDLERLSALGWRLCLDKVLFPLLTTLLSPPAPSAPPAALEEMRMRACALLSKVFLQHLNALLSLEEFTSLWLRMLDFMDRYMQTGSELAEAVPESLKNMLLVMSTAGLFRPGASEATGHQSPRVLWDLTWQRIATFLPDLQSQLFPGATSPPGALSPAAGTAAPTVTAAAAVASPAAPQQPVVSVIGPTSPNPTAPISLSEAISPRAVYDVPGSPVRTAGIMMQAPGSPVIVLSPASGVARSAVGDGVVSAQPGALAAGEQGAAGETQGEAGKAGVSLHPHAIVV